MEEVPNCRKRCQSEDNLSPLFWERFQGKIQRVGKGGLIELFFPKNRSSVPSLNSSPRRNVYSVISHTSKTSKSVTLPKITNIGP